MIIVNCLKNTIQISIFLRFVFPEDCNNVTFKINDLSCAENHEQLKFQKKNFVRIFDKLKLSKTSKASTDSMK